MIKVAAAIIEQKDFFLICQRPAGKHLAFFWEFPGGKVENDETFEECVIRECREELGIDVNVQSLFEKTTYFYPNQSIQFAFFLCTIQHGYPIAQEGQKICWVKRSELLNYKFCPADYMLIQKLLVHSNKK